MTEHQASRTLLKSPPELWSECSDVQSLARHLEEHFGEIRITRLEPETTVAWEGDRARGTVTLKPSGWGTKVVLTAETETPEPPEPVVAEPPEPPEPPAPPVTAAVERPRTPPAPRPEPSGFLARMRRFFGPQAGAPAPEPVVTAPVSPTPTLEPVTPEPEPEPVAEPESSETTEALTAALESLGQAHHRPFSRA